MMRKLIIDVLLWLLKKVMRPVLRPPAEPHVLRVNVELLERLYKADFMLGFIAGTQPTWLAKQLHDSHRN